MNKKVFVMLLVIALCFAACSKADRPAQEEKVEVDQPTVTTVSPEVIEENLPFSQGEVVMGVYTNAFFDLELRLPGDWTLLSLEAVDRIMDLGKNIVESRDDALAKKLAPAEVVSLMGIFRYPLENEVPYNASLLISAEKLDETGTLVNGAEYLEESLALLAVSGMPFEINTAQGDVTIHGHTYSSLGAVVEAGDQVIYQDYYARATKGYVITMVVTYVDEEDQSTLRQALGL